MTKVFLFLLVISHVVSAMTQAEFKNLALSMVDDLEKEYGQVHVENGVRFDMADYRKIIARTKIIFESKQIQNFHIVTDSSGKQTKVLEYVDAVNYFPSNEQIVLFQDAWDKKFATQKWDELKLLIHHEFVPYFLKRADRKHEYSLFLSEIYEKRMSLADLKPGFYKVINMEDPVFEAMSEFYWYFINYDKNRNQLTLVNVENPVAGIWCMICYVSPPIIIPLNQVTPTIATISGRNITLDLSKVFGDSGAGNTQLTGRPYLRMFNKRGFGLGFMDQKFTGSVEEFVKKKIVETKMTFFSRVEELGPFEWKAKKNFPLFGYRVFADPTDCEAVKRQVAADVLDACNLPEVPMERSYCKEENAQIIDLKQGRGADLYKDYSCAIMGRMHPPLNQEMDDYKRSLINTNIMYWRQLGEIHRGSGN